MQPQLSAAAKTKVAAVVAVLMAGATAWQIATRDGFTWWDLIPVIAAAAGVATTDHVENTIGSPAAKAVVHGALSAVSVVAASLAAVVGPEPSGVSITKLTVAALGTLAVWYTPELAALAVTPGPQTPTPTAPAVAPSPLDGLEITDALHALDALGQQTPAPSPAPAVASPAADVLAAAAAAEQAAAAGQDHTATAPIPGLPLTPAALGPLPIEAAALAATTATVAMPAIPPQAAPADLPAA